MTQTEVISNGMNFDVTGVERNWANYGVVQYFGTFEGKPKRYQVVSVTLPTGTQNIVKSPFFIPVPTKVAQELTHAIANELNMQIKEESNDGLQYLAQLVSPVKREVEPGDIVAWGIAVRHNVVGNFRINASLLRLVCSNGLMEPAENSEISTVEKSYNIEKMKESFLEKARLLQETFEERLEIFRQFKNYKLNQELAQQLTKTFPKPIIQDIITLGEKKTIKEFSPVDLWTAYNVITYQISHRRLKLTTKFDWSLKATKIFENYIKEQAQTS
jgi:hypothetical protein